MLCAYYDKSCDSKSLFEDLEIAKDSSFEEHLNKYDVIYLDMTWFIFITDDIKNILSDLQERVKEELCIAYPELVPKKTLPETLAQIHEDTGNKFIFIIDEWDALFREAKNDTELQKAYIQLLRGLFKSSLTDKMIEATYITGILPIKKYGTQSAMTDFKEYTMLEPNQLAQYVGFTNQEVSILCEENNMNFDELKRWYDGYSFSQIKSIYSPNSVMEAITNRKIANYWTRTESYESLKIYIDMDEDGLKETIVQMLGGAHCPINTISFQNDMTSIQSRDDVLALFVHLGYLAYDADKKTVYIPNEEIRQEFIRAVRAGKHKEVAKLIQNSD
jgi:hypothetical protein